MVQPSRNVLALFLAVLAAVATVGAVLALYLRFEVAERDAFADRAAAAFDRPEVRQVVAREVVVQLIDRGSTDLVAARPVLEGVVEALVGTPPFERLVRAAAAQTHQVLFERDDNSLVFDLADVSTVVLSGMRSVSPDIAKRVPDDVDARLVDVRERNFAGDTLEAADTVRRLAVWLPVLAVLLLAGALLLAADRRRTLTRYGLALGMSGIVAVVALSTGRAVLLGSIQGTDEIPRADIQAAVGGVWDSFLGDLRSLILIVALVGFVLASSILTVADPVAVRARVAALTRRPANAPLAALRGIAFVALGILVLLQPGEALRFVAYVGGAGLVYLGSSELLRVLGSSRRVERASPVRRVAAVVGVAVLTALAATMTAAFVLDRGEQPAAVAASPGAGCNGMRELCGRRVNDVLFPGTHNAMSAADVPGWALTNQRRAIPRQLKDGIRLFLLDPHYGRKGQSGRVLTDFAGEGRDRNKVARELDPAALAAARRLGPSLTRGSPGPRDIWLCHTLCELGATRFTDTLEGHEAVPGPRAPERGGPVPGELRDRRGHGGGVPQDRHRGHGAGAGSGRAAAHAGGDDPHRQAAAGVHREPRRGRAVAELRLRVGAGHAAEGRAAPGPELPALARDRGQPDPDAQPLDRQLPAAAERQPQDPARAVPDPADPALRARAPDAGVVRGGGLLRPGRAGGRGAAHQPRALVQNEKAGRRSDPRDPLREE